MSKSCYKGLTLLTIASLLSLGLTQAYAANKISLAEIAAELKVTFPAATKTQLEPILKTYNKQNYLEH